MRVLITGGFGFLGRHLIEQLVDVDPIQIAVTDLQAAPSDRRHGVSYTGGVDILDPASIREAVAGADAVIHLAGLVSFWRGDSDRLYKVNQVGTRNVAEACAHARVKRLLHVSSVAAIGFNDREDAPVDESFVFDWSNAAGKDYMLSKKAAEEELAAAARAGVSVVSANPGALYGPGDRTNIGLFQAVRARRLPFVLPGGTNVVDARDVARGLRLLLLSSARKERFILGGHNLRFSEIVRTIARVLNEPVTPRILSRRLHGPMYLAAKQFERVWPGRLKLTSDHIDSAFRFRYFSSAKAARVLGWRVRIPFARTCADAAAEMEAAGLLPRAA